MEQFYLDYLERLQALHHEIAQAVAGLPQTALDWTPASQTNSMVVLVMHLVGAERYWIGDVALGQPSGRDRAVEFQVSGLSTQDLDAHLEAAGDYARNALQGLELAVLARPCVSPRDGRGLSTAWALLHALEHTAIHLGHIQLTRQLWESAFPAGDAGH
jgi:uncharacterized damage-inducible protein DinB